MDFIIHLLWFPFKKNSRSVHSILCSLSPKVWLLSVSTNDSLIIQVIEKNPVAGIIQKKMERCLYLISENFFSTMYITLAVIQNSNDKFSAFDFSRHFCFRMALQNHLLHACITMIIDLAANNKINFVIHSPARSQPFTFLFQTDIDHIPASTIKVSLAVSSKLFFCWADNEMVISKRKTDKTIFMILNVIFYLTC